MVLFLYIFNSLLYDWMELFIIVMSFFFLLAALGGALQLQNGGIEIQ